MRMDSILRLSAKCSLDKTFYAIPEEWEIEPFGSRRQNQMPPQSLYDGKPIVIRYKDNIPVPFELVHGTERKDSLNSWFVVSNGQFATHINADLLERGLAGVNADVVAVNAEPEMLEQREKVRLTAEGQV